MNQNIKNHQAMLWLKAVSYSIRVSMILMLAVALPVQSVHAEEKTLTLTAGALTTTKASSSIVILRDTLFSGFPDLKLFSKHWIAVDYSSQMVVARSGKGIRIEPASMTKVLTSYVVFKALANGRINESDMLIPEKFTEGSRMFLDSREPVSVGELIRGMVIQSGNDASITLAKKVSGSEEAFAHEMNKVAKDLGMTASNFTNASGLPAPNHYSSLDDLAILAIALIRDYPEYYSIYAEKEYTYNNIRQPNRNALLSRNVGADGIKTGHTNAAGYCLMSSAIHGERRVVVITAKADSEAQRLADSESLIRALYDNTETVKIYRRDQVVESIDVWKGSESTVPVGFNHDMILMVPKGAGGRLSAKLVYNQPIIAPLNPGQVIGNIVFMLDDKTYAEYPIMVLQEVGKASWYRLLWHSLRLWMQ